jgi:hypothetical protein
MVVETIKNQKSRTNLKQLHATDTMLPDITGGYIFKFEWQAAEEPIVECPGQENCWISMEVVDPPDINAEQEAWLADYLYTFTQVIHSPSISDPNTGYAAYIDPASFIDQIIINELGREYDSYVRSAYFYKDRDGLLNAGPLWDYNLSLGTGLSMMWSNMTPEGWNWDNSAQREPDNDWFLQLVSDPGFLEALRARWWELRSGLLSETSLNERIDELTAPLTAAAVRNFERWPNLQTRRLDMFESPVSDTWEEQIAILKEFLMARIAWIDDQWLHTASQRS